MRTPTSNLAFGTLCDDSESVADAIDVLHDWKTAKHLTSQLFVMSISLRLMFDDSSISKL